MLQLFANGQQLDTAGVKFNLTLKNPMFREKLEGGYVYNIDLPGTEKNNKIFGFPSRIEKVSSVSMLEFRAIFNGIEFITGATIIATKSSIGTIQGNITVGLGDIIYQLQDKLLKEIDLGGSRVLTGEAFVPIDYYNDTAAGEYPEFDFVLFPVHNENFYDGTDQETNWKTNIKILNEYYTGSFHVTDPHTLVPFPYVVYLIDRIFRQYGYSLGENVFLNNADLRRLVLYNNFADIVTVAIEDPGPPISFSFTAKANHRINLQNQVPEYKVLDFLNDLRFLGLSYFVNPYKKQADIKFLKDIIKSPNFNDITNSVTKIKSVDNASLYDGFKFIYALSDDAWGDEYFKNELSDYKLKDPVDTSINLPTDENTEVNEIRLVTDIDIYFIFRWDPDSVNFSWFYFCYHYEDLKLDGENNFPVEPQCCPLFVENIINDHPTTRVYLMPKILQPGTNDFFVFSETKELFVNEPGKRFLFYRGLQWDSLHGSYPLGTPDVYTQEGNKIAEANLALKWEGEYGLYNQLWKPVIENFILKTRTVEIEKLFTAVEIRNFDFSEKVRVKGVDYLVKEIKIPITDRAILPASMTCYKV